VGAVLFRPEDELNGGDGQRDMVTMARVECQTEPYPAINEPVERGMPGGLRRMNGALVLAVVVGFVGLVACDSAAATDRRQSYLDELRFAEQQLGAVTTDMYAYLGWGFDEKGAMQEASRKALVDLDEIKTRLTSQEFPEAYARLKELTLQEVDALQQIYRGVEHKELEVVKEEFVPFRELAAAYETLLKEVWLAAQGGNDEEPIDSKEEELRWFGGEDLARYQEAIGLLENERYGDAYDVLKALELGVEGVEASSMVQLRLSDALLMMDGEMAKAKGFDGLETPNEGLRLLEAIVVGDEYSPGLYEAFYKWRTTKQSIHHGMSNYSSIPNTKYNKRRWDVLQRVRGYAAEHPDDRWAKTQAYLLWDLSNILRGGPMGNDNLIHWGLLYARLEASE